MQLHYDVYAGTGPYVLMVHGFLSSRAQWRPNLAALAGVMRPVVVELWGHGRSPAPAEPAHYHPDAYIAALDQIRERLGGERWFLCGQSFGAALTMRYALTHVCGERETRFAPLRAFAERTVPGLQVVGANAGHAVNIQAAEVFNAAVVDFCGRHVSQT